MCEGDDRCWRARTSEPDDYPGMCPEHGADLREMWRAAPKSVQVVINTALSPDECPAFLLPALADERESLARVLLCPLGFWALTPELCGVMIVTGVAQVLSLNADGWVPPQTASYLWLARLIGEILPYLADDEAKWRHLSENLAEGLLLCFESPMRVVPVPSAEWRDDWVNEWQRWLQVYDSEGAGDLMMACLDELQLVMTGDRAGLVEVVQVDDDELQDWALGQARVLAGQEPRVVEV